MSGSFHFVTMKESVEREEKRHERGAREESDTLKINGTVFQLKQTLFGDQHRYRMTTQNSAATSRKQMK